LKKIVASFGGVVGVDLLDGHDGLEDAVGGVERDAVALLRGALGGRRA
jgi:hypothetical protein